MPTTIYPGLIYPADDGGLIGVTIPGINVNTSGATAAEAVADAAAILQEVIDDLTAEKHPLPAPVDVDDIDQGEAALAFFTAILPGKSVRLNITLPEGLVARIDEQSPNRSAFLAAAATSALNKSG